MAPGGQEDSSSQQSRWATGRITSIRSGSGVLPPHPGVAPFAFFVTALALTPNHYLTKRSTKRDSLSILLTFRKASPSILDALGISHSSEAQGLTEICQQSHRQSVVQWKPDLLSLPPGPDSMTPGYVTGHSAQCVSAGNTLHFPPVTADELTCRSRTYFYLLIFPLHQDSWPWKAVSQISRFFFKANQKSQLVLFPLISFMRHHLACFLKN